MLYDCEMEKKLICIWDILAPKFCAFAFLKSALRKLHLPISNFHFMESLNFASSQPPPLPTQLNTKINIIWGKEGGRGQMFPWCSFYCELSQHLYYSV